MNGINGKYTFERGRTTYVACFISSENGPDEIIASKGEVNINVKTLPVGCGKYQHKLKISGPETELVKEVIETYICLLVDTDLNEEKVEKNFFKRLCHRLCIFFAKNK
jgi:hypothetical protein